MKKSNVFAILLLICGIGCCIAASFTGMGIGALRELVRSENRSGPQFFSDMQELYDVDADIQVDRLILDIDTAECVIKTGESCSLKGGKNLQYSWDGSTLKITQRSNGGWIHFGGQSPIELTLTAPLSELDISVDAGSVDISGIDVQHKITANVDAGAISLNDINTDALELDVDAGKITYSGVLRGPANLDCDAGSIQLELQAGSTIGHVSGEADAGTVKVSVNGKTIIKHSGMDEVSASDIPGTSGRDVLTYDCDAGSILVQLFTRKTS